MQTPTPTEKGQRTPEVAQFTPGPWRVETLGGILRVTKASHDDFNDDIAVMGDSADGTEQANAHLIAAAPDLLAALKAFADEAKSYHDNCGHGETLAASHCDSICELIPNALDVIAKAEGRA